MRFDTRARVGINITTSGDNTIIAAPTDGSYIIIDHLDILLTGVSTTVTLKDGASSNIALYALPINGSFVYDNANPDHNALELSSNNAFVINLGAGGGTLTGLVLYRKTS